MPSYRITVVGAGYVGLVSACGFAELGHEVVCVEKDKEKLAMLEKGISPIYEPGLEELLKNKLTDGSLRFTDDLNESANWSQVIFICVGTPPREDGSADLSQVEEVARRIAGVIDDYKLIVEKSTVPVKTAQWIKRTIELYGGKGKSYDVASNPEFLREGSALNDFFNPDRIVIGVESERAEKILKDIYAKINAPILVTDINTAEIIKHASNSFLAMKISFINMVADLCEAVGADVKRVAKGMGLDRRIGEAFLGAGIGYGGSCFPKDLKAFIRIAEEHHVDFSLLKEVQKINELRIERFLKKIKDVMWVLKDKEIAIWGLSFKPDTDDIREAPSLKLVPLLLSEGVSLRLYDPKATNNFKKVFPENDRVRYFTDPYSAVEGAHALVILTEWEEFRKADLARVKELLLTPLIFDGRNIFEPEEVQKFDLEYYPVGRGRSCVE
ncbi:MAG: UDP-glucose/GDP-mannose dehydrogenase family protein [Synergistetes bacterium]|nr:UDP-glucose/GDP-mannose dehydrogenase family protein [Synergistota bacterium]